MLTNTTTNLTTHTLHPSCDVEQSKEIESTSFPCTTQAVCKHLSYNVLRNAFNFSYAILSNEEYKINEGECPRRQGR